MSMREDLQKAIEAVAHYDRNGVQPTWASEAMRTLVRDHGPALLEVVADAERYRWLRDESNPNVCAFYLSVGMALHGVKFTRETVDQFIDHSRTTPTEEARGDA